MRKLILVLLVVWVFCLTMTQRLQTDALRQINNILFQQENDIRDLQQKVEPKTHLNYYGPDNGMETGPIQEY